MLTEDPKYPVGDWQYEVANRETDMGYMDWLSGKRDADEQHDTDRKVAEVLCDAGEDPLGASEGDGLDDIVSSAGSVLDHSYMNNTVVVKTNGGRYFIGEMGFEFREVAEDEARERAAELGDGDEE